MAEYFVVIAGVPKQPDSEIVLVAATSALQAHGMAATEYRRKRHLASSVYVLTSHRRCHSEADATLFMSRLIARMDDSTAAANTSQEATHGI